MIITTKVKMYQNEKQKIEGIKRYSFLAYNLNNLE
jgi:hypothetical protein